MKNAEMSNEGNPTNTPVTNECTGKGRPPTIVLTSEAKLISLQRKLNSVVSVEFFHSSVTGTRITTTIIANVSAQRDRTQSVSQPAAIAICKTGNRRTQQVSEAVIMQNRNYSTEGTCGRQHRGQQGGHSSRNTQPLIDNSLLLFTDPISNIGSNRHNKSSNSDRGKYASGPQSNLRSVSAG
jgi:hypothetical protein